MFVYRIYCKTGTEGQWEPMRVGHHTTIIREWTDEAEARREYDKLVVNEGDRRRERDNPKQGTMWVSPFVCGSNVHLRLVRIHMDVLGEVE